MNQYPAWKKVLGAAVLAIGALIALPNVFGKAPSLQISREDGGALIEATTLQVESLLERGDIADHDSYVEDGRQDGAFFPDRSAIESQ